MKKLFLLLFAFSVLCSMSTALAVIPGPSVVPEGQVQILEEITEMQPRLQALIDRVMTLQDEMSWKEQEICRLETELELAEQRLEGHDGINKLQQQTLAEKEHIIHELHISLKTLFKRSKMLQKEIVELKKSMVAQKNHARRFFPTVHLPSLLAGCIVGGIAVIALYKYTKV